MLGMALAATTYFPIYRAVTHFANPAIEAAAQRAPVKVLAAPGSCSAQFDPLGRQRPVRSCDIAREALARAGVPYSTGSVAAGSVARVHIGGSGGVMTDIAAFEGAQLSPQQLQRERAAFSRRLNSVLAAAGYPLTADPAAINYPLVLLMLLLLMLYSTLVTAPMAAWLVELFPARIRYTSLSVSYHIGAGWFGGFMPAVAFTLVAITGDIYSGLWYPVIVAAVTVIAGVCLLPETAGPGSQVSTALERRKGTP